MSFSTDWLGPKRVAFVPLFRSNAKPPDQIPPAWETEILRRVVYDPRLQANGADRSLRAWLRAASSGLADIDPLVLPMQTIDRQHVEADDLEGTLGGRLRDLGMDAAVLVMLGGRGAGTNRGFWSRVVMKESNGVWLMELIHGLTGFKDLYHFDNDVDPPERAIDSFDEMSAGSQTHPTAFTKNDLGWLDATPAIPLHAGASVEYQLQHIGLAQPPMAGRAAAIRIGDDFPYVMVEARKRTDQFEAGMPSTGDGQERGIACEGVIAYRVQTRNTTVQEREGHKKPLYLMTLTALQPGQSAVLDNGVTLAVTGEIPGGFTIRIIDVLGKEVSPIVWHHDQTGEIQIWFMHEHQLVRRATVLGEDGNPAFVGLPFEILGVGDMDGFGKADIVWHHRDTGETQIWAMNEHQLVRRRTVVGEDGNPALVGPPFRIVGVGDMDGDGQADIVWHHDQTDETQIWFMNGYQLNRRATAIGEDGQPAFLGPPFRIVGASSTIS